MAYQRRCVHTETLWQGATDEQVIYLRRAKVYCDTCSVPGPNLWLCLHADCFYVGCGDAADDHSTQHYDETQHNLTLNLSSMKIWCYVCSVEVFRDHSARPHMPRVHSSSASNCPAATAVKHTSKPEPSAARPDDSDSDSSADDSQRPRGLTGLRNIGNTCYMNAALQALSNCLPMTQFFLECPGYVPVDKSPGLAKSYMKLMVEIWHKNRSSYVTPTSIFNSIRAVHPMFRGYLQHDSQEFLRCFMDHLHEELKQPIAVVDDDAADGHNSNDNHLMTYRRSCMTVDCDMSEPSDTDYETCDSGLSSESNSLSADVIPQVDDNDSVEQSADTEQSTLPEQSAVPVVAPLPPVNDSSANAAVESDIKTTTTCCEAEVSKPLAVVVGDSVSMDQCDGPACTAGQCRQQSEAGDGEMGTVSVEELTSAVCVPPPSSDCTGSDTTSLLSTSTTGKSVHDVPETVEPTAAVDTHTTSSRKLSSSRDKQSMDVTDKTLRLQRSCDDSLQKPSRPKPPVQYVSIISAIFDGKILSSVQCLTCERVSCTKETFQDLSLPIPGKDQLQYIRASSQQFATSSSSCDSPLLTAVGQRNPCAETGWRLSWLSSMFSWMFSWFWGPMITLQDCLAAFFSADDLKGDNMYSCEKCKKLRNGVKFSKVLQLPEILSVHLKRFRHEFMFSSKISNYVSFPLEGLDMRPYLHKDCKDTVTSYDLVAVICHHGTAGGGHYTTYALNYVNLTWYEYDDQIVTEVDPQQVENCEAYVLFYRKRNEEMLPLRQNAEQILKRNVTRAEKSLMSFFVSQQWIIKFNTFAEPGPITNHDFLCQHGELRPSVAAGDFNQLILEIPPNLWEFLHKRFGGGPAVNRLSVCKPCLQEAERLRQRQQMEKQAFLELKAEFQEQYSTGAVYVLSMAWFREWENFVCCKTNVPPGPIDNKHISQVKNGITTLIANSDYAQISQDTWQLLYGIYGGGPELLLKPAAMPTPSCVMRKTDDAIDVKPEPATDK